MNQIPLEQIQEHINRIPGLPANSVRVLGLTNSPTATARDVVDAMRVDPAITSALLRLANSAYYRRGVEIHSVEDAVKNLGMLKVAQLVLVAHVSGILSPAQPGYGLLSGALFKHSIGVGLAAERIARRMNFSDRGLCFTAGLLHDMGKLVLSEHVSREYENLAQRVQEMHCSFHEAERETFGFTHAELGARIAERWNLPAPLVRCVRYHHAPCDLPDPDPAVDIVHLADALCLTIGLGAGDDGSWYRAETAVEKRSGMREREFEEIGCEVVLEVKAVQTLLEPARG